MNIPFVPEDLLEIDNYKIVYKDSQILVIDNWYRNYEKIYEILRYIPLPRWKWSDQGKNFKEYYDCRPIININHPDTLKINFFIEVLKTLIKKNFNYNHNLTLQSELLEFNFFKTLKEDLSADLQFYPHVDFKFNCIVYLDKISSGGTALYPDVNLIENNEHIDLLVDVSKYKKILIESKPNRLAIFNGKVYHGGYITNYNKYINNWRMNQILFFD